MYPAEIEASLVLNGIPELGPARLRLLVQHFGQAIDAVKVSPSGWANVPGFDQGLRERLATRWTEALDNGRFEADLAREQSIRILLSHQGPFPELLRHISDPPPVLYVRGNESVLDRLSVSLVGSRKSTPYGERVARRLAMDLALSGVVTVSGLARGIDTLVHRATLENNGLTVAVIGSGLGRIYPPENRELASRIAEAGAVLSEFPMLTGPFPANFPRRNRIISGLSRATVLVEGGATSGSLITARLAAEQGRDVFAVPGPITSPLSAAPHLLLKSGAALAESAADILEALGILPVFGPVDGSTPEACDEKAVLSALGEDSLPRELLAARMGKSVSEMSFLLLQLEMGGFISSGADGRISRR